MRWTGHWLFKTKFVVVDLDYGGDDDEFLRRLTAVEDALGDIPYLLFRSSSSRGLHVYVFFEQSVETPRARKVVVDVLARSGLFVCPGFIEVWPANQALRLPLGRGSCLLDAETLAPLAARFDKGGRLRRDVPASIALLKAMVAKARVPFGELENAQRSELRGPPRRAC